tara:strand:+ start:907 stop:1236 length:330 start_codon:yes stop_codon:yes gene_type:complete
MELPFLPSTDEELTAWKIDQAGYKYSILKRATQEPGFKRELMHYRDIEEHLVNWLQLAVSKWPEHFLFEERVSGDATNVTFCGVKIGAFENTDLIKVLTADRIKYETIF